MRPVSPDDTLSRITGHGPFSRSELSRRLWDYIRSHGLQDRERKLFVNADEMLEPVFNGRRRVTMLELNRLIDGHLE